jgi:hypothetical protein
MEAVVVDHRIRGRTATWVHSTLRQQRIDATSERMRVHLVSLAIAAVSTWRGDQPPANRLR